MSASFHARAALSDLELLARLIAFPSVSREPSRPIADFVCQYAADSGCRVWRQEYDQGRKANLLVWRGPGRDGGLLLSGHLDVVPADELDWESDAFELTQRGDELRGRGVVDMKGFIAQALNALTAARDQDLRVPLALLLTSDEEIGSLGAQQFAAAWTGDVPLPRDAIVGEPTELRVARLSKGHLKLRLRIEGKAAHSGYPQLGVSAIERAIPVLEALRALRLELVEQRSVHSEHFADCPFPALNIGLISGGRAVNIVPDSCRIDLGVRLLPGQCSEQLIGAVQARLAQLGREIAAATALELVNDSPPLLCDESARANRVLMQLIGQAEAGGVHFASDAGTLQRLGIQCVLFGAGQMQRAHRANEGLPVEHWQEGRQRLQQVIQRFCVEDPG